MFESTIKSLREKNSGKLPFEDHIKGLKDYLSSLSESRKMGVDLLFLVTYMTAITTAEVSRPEIFGFTSERREYISSKYIRKVELFVKRWNYNYATALALVAERVKNDMLRSMLNRYGNALESGVPDDEFLRLELSTIRSVYRNTFEQGIEMLKKWGDAYIALMLSSTIVSIIIMVSVAIYAPTDLDSTLNSSYFLVLGISVFGLVTMYTAIPDDQKCHNLPEGGTYEQMIVRRMEMLVIPVLLITVIVLFAIGFNYGLIFLLIGVLLAPMGIFGMIDDTNIIKRDEDFTVFIRGLGSIMGGKGLTTTFALSEVDRKSLEMLGYAVDTVYTKLNLGLDEALVWKKFIVDSGSNLISKYLNIFRDSITLGGSPAEIGKIVSSSMLEQTLLRQKREMFSTGFIVLLIPMHAAMIAIFIFLYQILISMSHAITDVLASFDSTSAALSSGGSSVGGSMMGSVNIFVNFPEDKMGMYIATVVLIITIANILAGKIVKGGDRYMLYFFGSILFSLTGIICIVTPFIVDALFQIPTFGGV